jgi:hypothetical protein
MRIAHSLYPSREITVMLKSQNLEVRDTDGYTDPSGFWTQATNLRWVHMLSHRCAVIRIMEATSAVAKSCITQGSYTASTEGRWKKFLSLISPTAVLSGSDPMRHRSSIVER